MTDSTLPPEIRLLPVAERLNLVEQIWDSIVEDEHASELTEAQKAELGRRVALHDESPNRGIPWEDVRNRLSGEQ
jgi:putative addiction module component (TIGR02574 family)